MRLRKRILKIHLWFGLISGIIFMIVSITGTLFVFSDEIIDIVGGTAKYVAVPYRSERLPPEKLILSFKERHPNRKIFYLDFYKESTRSIRIASSDKELKNFSYTYLNPYTGEELKSTRSYWFFYLLAQLHRKLLLGDIGHTIVALATLIFSIELIFGLILWYPRRWSSSVRKAIFTIKRKAGWKRMNYDLHKILGFYALVPALIIAITGLTMAYKPLGGFIQKILGGNPNAMEISVLYHSLYDEDRKHQSLAPIIDSTFVHYPSAKQMRIGFPFRPKETIYRCAAAKYIGILNMIDGVDFCLDVYTGKQIEYPKDIKQYQKNERVIYDLHSGYWWGIWGKIITFLVGLICSSLPVTGFVLWRNHRRKKV